MFTSTASVCGITLSSLSSNLESYSPCLERLSAYLRRKWLRHQGLHVAGLLRMSLIFLQCWIIVASHWLRSELDMHNEPPTVALVIQESLHSSEWRVPWKATNDFTLPRLACKWGVRPSLRLVVIQRLRAVMVALLMILISFARLISHTIVIKFT